MYYDDNPFQTTHWTHPTSAIIASAKKGCVYCRFVIDAIRYFEPDEFPVGISSFLSPSGGCSLRVDYTIKGAVGVQVYTPIDQEPAWPGITHGPELSPSPDSPQAFKFIQSCLLACNENHKNCSMPPPQSPTRLIDVQPQGLRPTHVRLVETRSPPPSRADLEAQRATATFPYIALSYCWGTGKTLTTKTDNFSALKAGFLLSSLPQTLQDAVIMTRKIGQRYIWIDALCIIQDSPTDWEVEASRMASVYQNAFLTIVAGTAAASDEGFLQRAHLSTTEFKKPFQAAWPPPTSTSRANNMSSQERQKQNKTILAARLAFSDLEHSHSRTRDKLQRIPNPWATRGWTFQEQLLSTRMLLFTGYELRWICPSASLCECTYLQQHQQEQSEEARMDPLARSIFPMPLTKKGVYDTWHDIVEEYTTRSLTYGTDRLPAVSGLARVVRERLSNIQTGSDDRPSSSKYLAGLWEGNLTMDLTWRARFVAGKDSTSHGNAPRSAGSEYIAPTFSWASVTNPVCCRLSQPEWTQRCIVEDADCVVVGANPLGRVKSGFVTLRGHLQKSILLDPYQGRGDLYYTEPPGWGERFKVDPDQLLEEFDVSLSSSCQDAGKQGQMERSVRRMRCWAFGSGPMGVENGTPPRRVRSGAEVYLFLLGQTPGSRINERVKLAVYFIVLGLSADHPGKFERVGCATGEVDEGKLEELLRLSSRKSVVAVV
ncbi:heterokaryon incompatibility protein-domain-containing protein [Pseudoneurospora amorphoporcata]|uniref:Heterokaryon incompatibility protein-domain-containing protein n=1 Tax=Pseudoneurospora amorphoporcata TaxID=241081 RepID=A0AAN6SII9_9PEZI|nr:heterokaryon incompatibility protein-domain-containing protein [Pseudoneurospora amorphoporcata]